VFVLWLLGVDNLDALAFQQTGKGSKPAGLSSHAVPELAATHHPPRISH